MMKTSNIVITSAFGTFSFLILFGYTHLYILNESITLLSPHYNIFTNLFKKNPNDLNDCQKLSPTTFLSHNIWVKCFRFAPCTA